MSNSIDKIVFFLDPLGRTILGVRVDETDDTITVMNPAVLHAGLNEGGKIQVNLIPAFFREFLKDWNSPLMFTYQKKNITLETNQSELEDKLIGQYNSMWASRPDRATARAQAPVRELTPEPEKVPEKLNLFDVVENAGVKS